jgi:ATP-dependent Clp protease ATP-binding subunit ClpA
VGYEEGGQLTEAVRTRPYTVILFDEVEKAHPDVVNVLLQLLDDGRLTDGQGRTVDFRQSLVIMTSNLWTDLIAGVSSDAERKKLLDGALRGYFRPEFLNRLDDIVIFHPLSEAQIEQIVDLQIHQVNDRLKDRGVQVALTKAARARLATSGFDPQFGARPLKRTIQRELVDPLTVLMLSGKVPDGSKVKAELENERIALVVGPGKTARPVEASA